MKKEYWINVQHVDNRMVIFLNGETIWDSGIIHDDPQLDKYINITELLVKHSDHSVELIFEGFNDTYTSDGTNEGLNPWHFQYRVFERVVDADGKIIAEENMLAPYNEKHLSNPNIRAINNCYQIVRRNGTFKVVSNALSQNFYN
ncbi:MAG: hypothetical protein JST86_14520 [Bacteroidetes bacterium]|nr:hypothetical protein [Bacteroidota bacterium]